MTQVRFEKADYTHEGKKDGGDHYTLRVDAMATDRDGNPIADTQPIHRLKHMHEKGKLLDVFTIASVEKKGAAAKMRFTSEFVIPHDNIKTAVNIALNQLEKALWGIGISVWKNKSIQRA